MKILNLCRDDWSNFMFDNAKALQSVGVNCVARKLNKHAFSYSEQCAIASHKEIVQEIKKADVVQLFHSDTTFLQDCVNMKKRVVVVHAGSVYRDNHVELNKAFNEHVSLSFIALGEFAGLGAKNEHYIVGAVDTDKLNCPVNQKRPYVFGHFPSNPVVKGTAKIVEIMDAIQHNSLLCEFRYSTDRTSYDVQLRRMNDIDIYIELFKRELDGKKYGSFGITALEAGAMAKIVVTMNLSNDVYFKTYGDTPFVLFEDEKTFAGSIMSIMFMSADAVNKLRRETRQHIVEKHGYLPSGNRIKKILYQI